MTIIKYIFAIALISTLYSCGNSLNGRVESRGDKLYLVNESKTKEFKFTVKKTEIIDDAIFNYSTRTISLSAGDERFLGYVDSVAEPMYPIIIKPILKKYPPNPLVGVPLHIRIPKGAMLIHPKDELRDTIINGEKFSYRYENEYAQDRLHPIAPSKYKYQYEVTGQVESNKSRTDKDSYSMSN